MKYVDPFPVICDVCHLKSSQRVDDLLRLMALCPACGRSFESVGLRMRAHSDGAGRFWILTELALAIEDEGVIIADVEFDRVETLHDLINIVNLHLNGNINDPSNSVALVLKAAHRAAANMFRSLVESDGLLDLPLSSVFRPCLWDEPSSEYDGLAGDVG